MSDKKKILKISLNEYLQLISHKLKREKSCGFPVIYNIETTNHCHMNCIMCPRSHMKRKKQHMELDLFQVIIDQAKNWTDFIFLDHFGDPLLDPIIFDRIDYAKSKGLRVGIENNATTLTPEKSRKLIISKLDLLHISLDGTDQETYSYYRGKNANYELAVRNIEELISQKLELRSSVPYIQIGMIKMNRTVPHINKFIDLWSRPGIEKVLIKSFTTMNGSVDPGLSTEYSTITETLPKCYFPWSSVTILVDGRVVPCCFDFDGKVVLGDLTKDSLVSVWNGEKMKHLRKEHILGDYTKNELCRNCCSGRGVRGLGFISKRIRNVVTNNSIRGFDTTDVEMWYG